MDQIISNVIIPELTDETYVRYIYNLCMCAHKEKREDGEL